MLGKPKQDVSVSGGLIHAHTRDPFLASLPKEALEQLTRSYDEVLAKYIPNASRYDLRHSIQCAWMES